MSSLREALSVRLQQHIDANTNDLLNESFPIEKIRVIQGVIKGLRIALEEVDDVASEVFR